MENVLIFTKIFMENFMVKQCICILVSETFSRNLGLCTFKKEKNSTFNLMNRHYRVIKMLFKTPFGFKNYLKLTELGQFFRKYLVTLITDKHFFE